MNTQWITNRDAQQDLTAARLAVQSAERNLEDAVGRDEIQFVKGALSILRAQERIAQERYSALPDIPDEDL